MTIIPSPSGHRAGLLVAIEGIDNLGKTTLCGSLGDELVARGYRVERLAEFGGAGAGPLVRGLVREGWGRLPPEAQMLLIGADRLPRYRSALTAIGDPRTVVLCDRYLHSAVVYQSISAAASLPATARRLQDIYNDAFVGPHVLLLLDGPVELSIERGGDNVHSRPFLDEARTRFCEFREEAAVLDASSEPDLVLRAALDVLERYLPRLSIARVPEEAIAIARSVHGSEALFSARDRDRTYLTRKTGYPAGVYRVAGGGIRPNEQPLEAVRREFAEESGLDPEGCTISPVAVISYECARGIDSFVSYLFEITLPKGAVPKDELDAERVSWLPIEGGGLAAALHRLEGVEGEARPWALFRAAALAELLAFPRRGSYAAPASLQVTGLSIFNLGGLG